MKVDELLTASFRVLMYDEMEQYTNAINALANILANQSNTHGYNNLGIAYFEIGDYKMAFQCFNESLQIDPKNEVAFINRGHLFEKSGDWLAARRDYSSAIEIMPSNPTYWRCRAYLYKQEERWHEALQDFLEAQKIEPLLERTNREIEELKSRLGADLQKP
ncbi:MAG: tetratricopeptide repeat protein [Cyclobacteriaceae bacterium]